MGYYVVLRGPLGVGKTTVAAALARSLGARGISVDAIADPAWDGGSVRLYVRANAVAADLVRRALRRGRPAVVDGCF